jgi:4-amino-4-deoxy-L-arabinose transferase-like glycosyltransferase
MSTTFPLTRTKSRERSASGAKTRTWAWHRLALVVILALSGVLELWRLDRIGYANQFYAAAVLSMLQNWHAFFFNSLDAAGFVTIDKPPLGFWVQVLSARLLGFSGVSILLPEALATVASVALLYQLIQSGFGRFAGLLAALMLAVVPVAVVVGRNNTIDSLLVTTLLVAAWTMLRATERGSLKWLIVTGVIVGLGFEIKMLQAYLVVPALGLVYLVAAPRSLLTRVWHLVVAALAMLIVSFAWPLAVDLTPAALRPWVDSTQNNSAISLALGYNGIERLVGQNRTIGQFLTQLGPGGLPGTGSSAGAAGGFGGPGGIFNNGPAGVLRLLDEQLAGQASWLLPLSIGGVVVSGWYIWRDRRRLSRSRSAQLAIIFATWLASAGGFFSVAGFFHSYYLVMLGPPVAALAAIGAWGAWRALRAGTEVRSALTTPIAEAVSNSLSSASADASPPDDESAVPASFAPSRRAALAAWLVPFGIVVAALVQAHVLGYYTSVAWTGRLVPIVVGGALLGAVALMAVLLLGGTRLLPGRAALPVARSALGVALAALLVSPTAWSGYSTFVQSGDFLPTAGPQVTDGRGGFGLFGGPPDGGSAPDSLRGGRGGATTPTSSDGAATSPRSGSAPTDGSSTPATARGFGGPGGVGGPSGFGGGGATATVISFLEANQGSNPYLVAVSNSQSAASIILSTGGKPVMSLGGFSGRDPIVDADSFATLVRSGQVRFVLLGGGFGGGSNRGGNSVAQWVEANGSLVPSSELGGAQVQLYDLGALQ